ncbi:HAD family hydrolase [Streptomyces armeniacus]|uniref:HAD family hydrolase n=1 Tax=Streptomyces armeniacus TaxID=83291 RepID=UPI001AD7F7CD|nr:HAD family hydrolase [Streptomyces armeniacus]
MSVTANASPATPVGLARLMGAARAVFFDFDGPLCRAFAGHPAALIAAELKTVVRESRYGLHEDWAASDDPHRILWGVRRELFGAETLGHEGRRLVAELERVLTHHERAAIGSAEPVRGAVELVRALHASGRRLMVTSNNAPEAVSDYLERAGIDVLFDGVIGRDPTDPLLMKPNPHSVIQAVKRVDLRAEECLLLGDQPTDHEAAYAVGVPFLGYARNAAKAARLCGGGAEHVVSDLRDVLAAVTG